MSDRKRVDWEAVEIQYRAGARTLRDIAEEYGCSHVAIQKKAAKEGWVRDLGPKIKAAADALVTKAQVTAELPVTERAVIAVNATHQANIRLSQRKDILRLREIVAALSEELAAEGNNGSINLSQRTDIAKKLSEATKNLVTLESSVHGIDTGLDGNGDALPNRVEVVLISAKSA